MITPSEVNNKYGLLEPFLAPLLRKIWESLAPYCEKHSFALVSRIKSLGSVCEKIETGRFASWSAIDDLIAFAIVIPTLIQEEAVVKWLGERFETVDIKRRGSTLKSPEVFRFDTTRFVGRLAAKPEATSRDAIHSISFEIQVRTAFDHAWVVTTHALTYKTPIVDWKQQRLAAELKATAEKMDLLILAFQEAAIRIDESPWPVIKAKKDIHKYFFSAIEAKRVPRELAPNDWSRFAENVYELGRRPGAKFKPDKVASTVIGAVDQELSSLGTTGVPMSLSLWQFTFASLVKHGVIKAHEIDYWPLITNEMETLYPEVKKVAPRFDLETR